MLDDAYFDLRGISPETYAHYRIPAYLMAQLPANREARILDFGCGYGQLLTALVEAGYRDVCGVDVLPSALEHCRGKGLEVIDGRAGGGHGLLQGSFALIIVNHVLKHMEKADIVPALKELRALLAADGALVVMVPNAQPNTGGYWAYEDFTHTMLFTSGSLRYVLRAAGFSTIDFLDVDCTAGLAWYKRVGRRLLLSMYRANHVFWNHVTASYTHAPSDMIFSYEIKACARA